MSFAADSEQQISDARREKWTIIEPSKGWLTHIGFREFWEHRDLLYFLAWRDIKVRYKQTVLGVSWAVIQPILTMVIFSVLFGRMAKIPSDGVPYPIFSFAALLPWTYFAQALNQSANSLVGSAHIVTKVYFPRLVVPTAAVIPGLVDFVIAFLVLAGLMVYYSVVPTLGIFLLPAFLLLAFITTLGFGYWFAALNIRYRDVRHAMPFFIQLWLFVTPVVYPSSMFPEPWRTFTGLNPMVGVVEGFRWALLGTDPPRLMILGSVLVSVFLLISGALYFRNIEQELADRV